LRKKTLTGLTLTRKLWEASQVERKGRRIDIPGPQDTKLSKENHEQQRNWHGKKEINGTKWYVKQKKTSVNLNECEIRPHKKKNN